MGKLLLHPGFASVSLRVSVGKQSAHFRGECVDSLKSTLGSQSLVQF